MSEVVVLALVRNEAKRYLPSALDAWAEFADKIVVLDDNSTDKTVAVARKARKTVVVERYGETQAAWGQEALARRQLWELGHELSSPGDYLFWLDADMVPAADPRDFLHPGCDTYFFPLYDLWGEDEEGRLLYREDAFWSAHFRPRAWGIRRPRSGDFEAEWSTRGVHCGHLPSNWQAERGMFVPPSHALLHYAYYDEADRHAKYAQYMEVRDQLSVPEVAHAASIVDETPLLKPLLKSPLWRLRKAANTASATSRGRSVSSAGSSASS